ncbi:MAG: hypothetical protein ABSH46_05140 [Bryobacteraceae bacterium]|jgi:hypothetical protein
MEAGHPVVPYVPFKTFVTALDALEAGLPNQLDRSVWPSYSGAIQGQLLGAFRFLALMDEGNCPTPALGELVSKRGARRELLRGLIERHYRTLVALDLTRTSPRQLDEAMRQYGLSGATHKKALSFFLQAAQFAGMPLSVLLKAKTRTAAFGHKRAAPAAAATETPAALSKTVRLRSGGTLTVTASLDLFSLGGEDRKLVFDLIDRLQEYESG